MGARVTACAPGTGGERASERPSAAAPQTKPAAAPQTPAGGGGAGGGLAAEVGAPKRGGAARAPAPGNGRRRRFPPRSTRPAEGTAAGQLSEAVEFLFLTSLPPRFETLCPFKEIAVATNRHR